ncbi:MAG: hypothetical protein PHP52_04220 [Bacteroidales bacterium]|nr:hypothetical protein [Bacteroidales bacterium]MDD2385967.1 hypothetical protein [Bacteroidales bacterium]MDD4217364.1 hypothetical protein [Bacteroidales bacterium]MDY0141265.1 hypothetical protein [Bacteroidales bacterium]
MKLFKLTVLAIIILCVNCFIIACGNNKGNTEANKNSTNDKISISDKDNLPEILKNDTLAEKYTVLVVDTFDTGEPLKVHYCDPQNPNDVKYEKQFFQNGKLFIEGPLENQRRNGKWVARYENGNIWSVGYYKDGLKFGASNVYYENGKIRYTKNYEKDVAEGLWEFYDENGDILGKVMYENGKKLWEEGTSDQ